MISFWEHQKMFLVLMTSFTGEGQTKVRETSVALSFLKFLYLKIFNVSTCHNFG
jgi:hypothetical protein